MVEAPGITSSLWTRCCYIAAVTYIHVYIYVNVHRHIYIYIHMYM